MLVDEYDDDERIMVRAERLRCLIAAIGEEPSMRAGEGCESGFVPGGWSYYFDDLDREEYEDELDLAWECASVAQSIRERQWDALERLGELAASGRGATLDDRWQSLSDADARRALLAAMTLGWQHEPPGVDGGLDG